MFQGFKSTFLSVFVSLIIAAIVFISLNAYHHSKQTVYSLTNQFLAESSRHVITTSSVLFSDIENKLSLSALALKNKNLIKDKEEILEFIWTINHQSPYFFSVYIADIDGNLLHTGKEPSAATSTIHHKEPNIANWIYRNPDFTPMASIRKEINYSPLAESWFRSTGISNKTYWSEAYMLKLTNKAGVTGTYPIFDDNNQLKMILAIDVSLDQLSNFISKQPISRHGTVLLLNKQSNILAMPNKLLDYHNESNQLISIRDMKINHISEIYAKQLELSHSNKINYKQDILKLKDETYFTKLEHFPQTFPHKWRLLVIIPEKNILTNINKLLTDSISITVMFIIITIFVVYLIAGQLTDPLLKLAKNTKHMQEYRFNDFQPIKSRYHEIQLMNDTLLLTCQRLASFNKYVPTELLHQIMEENDNKIELGGKTKEITLFFSEITDFSKIANYIKDEKQAQYLSRYQSELSRVLSHKKATIDRYVGDQIVAFWGAPRAQKSTPHLACRTALDCEQAIINLNHNFRQEGLPQLDNRVGLHFGKAVVGNFGSEERMVYTAIGNTVKICHALEHLNLTYGTKIIISEIIYDLVHIDFFCRWLDTIEVQGIVMNIYELISWHDDPIVKERESYVNDYEKALTYAINNEAREALDLLHQLSNHHPDDKAISYLIKTINEG